MSEPFLGELRMMSFNFPPKGWSLANGQFLPINQNQALFSLLGTMYGGNGQTTFALPNVQGRVPIHMGGGFTLGQAGGEPAHTLSMSEMPQHIHGANASSTDGTLGSPSGNLLARAAPANPYIAPTNLGPLNPGTLANTGGSQPHNNMQPYQTISFCIALQGIFPSRN
jgi:microcystin-dependent protein